MGVFNRLIAGDNGFGARAEVADAADITSTPEALAELDLLLARHVVLHLRCASPLAPEPLGRIGLHLGYPQSDGFQFVRNVGAKAKPFTRIARTPSYIETLHYDGVSSHSVIGYADIPPTAPNLFVDMRQVYSDLPSDLKAIVDTRYCLHGPTPPTTAAPMSDAPPFDPATAKRRPLAVRHPATGQPLPWLPINPLSTIKGLPDEEGRAILKELWTRTYKSDARYTTKTQSKDILIWEGLTTLHTNPSYPRHVDRTVWFFTVPINSLGAPDPYVAA